MDNIIKKYKALSQKCRFRIMHLILKSNVPICICEIMDALNKPQYAISRCLAVLKRVGLVIEEREGRILLYSPNKNDDFNIALFSSIILAGKDIAPILKEDLKRLQKRLSLRKDGKVVVTYRGNRKEY